jgi:hypothetical protein
MFSFSRTKRYYKKYEVLADGLCHWPSLLISNKEFRIGKITNLLTGRISRQCPTMLLYILQI